MILKENGFEARMIFLVKEMQFGGKSVCYVKELYHQQTAGGSICTATIALTVALN